MLAGITLARVYKRADWRAFLAELTAEQYLELTIAYGLSR